MMARRVLVTGSRRWSDTEGIRQALTAFWHPDTVLVHGACPTGADQLCAECWQHWGGRVEAWPADWKRWGRRAGPIRNREMVAAGADEALVFWIPGSRGTHDTYKLLKSANIPTHVFQGEES